MNYIQLYDREQYLFDGVRPSFHDRGYLTAFDFFCIVIWKANRSKSMVAARLIKRDTRKRTDLDSIVRDLSSALHRAPNAEERMRILIEDWKLRLPMASAILTVLWPETFTIYDVRVCGQLGNHQNLHLTRKYSALWSGYQAFVQDVRASTPAWLSLRDKDRWLWAKSFEADLHRDISGATTKLLNHINGI